MQNVQTDYLPIIADVSAPLLTAAAPVSGAGCQHRHSRGDAVTGTRKIFHWPKKYLLALSSAPAVGPMINCLTCDELWENIDCGVSATRPTPPTQDTNTVLAGSTYI